MPRRSVEDTGELSKDPGEWSAQAPLRSARSHRSTPLTQITRKQEHALPTSRAHLCDYRGAGGRMCVMVAQHS